MKIKVVGRRAPEDMPSGECDARCVRSEIKKRGKNQFAVLTFCVLAPVKYRGVALLSWLTVSENLNPLSKFVRTWEIASRRLVDPGDDLSPDIFVDKIFRVRAGFRNTPKSGKISDDDPSLRRKDSEDFLRVHEILSLVHDHIEIDIAHRHRQSLGLGLGVEGVSTHNNKDNSTQNPTNKDIGIQIVSAPRERGKRDMEGRGTASGAGELLGSGRSDRSSSVPDDFIDDGDGWENVRR